MTDAGPIPTGELPEGWVSAGGDFDFRHPATGLAVRADRRTGDADAETAGAARAWRVAFERHVGEVTDRRTVGAVTTHDAAVDAVLSCMRRVTDGPRGGGARGRAGRGAPEDPRRTALSTFAADVSLHDPVPTATDGGGPVDEVAYARAWMAKLDNT